VANLDKFFGPNRIAVIGASDTPGKVGHTVMRNLIEGGFAGEIYPINPNRDVVYERKAYGGLSKTPAAADLAIIATPAATTPGLIEEAGRQGVPAIMLLNAGFDEIGTEGRKLAEKVRRTAAKYPDMRLLGPNCLGLMVPGRKLNASFAGATPQPGHLAFVSQSGALCTSVLDWALEQQIGFSHFVSIGNMLDVSFADLIDYLGQSDQVRSIILYIESIKDHRGFMSAARAFSRKKPIIAYKAGRFAESASAAASHTGAMAGEDHVFDAAFERAGVERVFSLDDMFECAELLGRHGRPQGGRLAILTNAGGPGVMATDALLARGGALAELSPPTLEQLNRVLPACWSHRNPVDVIGDATPRRYADAAEALLKDKQIDALLVLITPQAMTDPTGCAEAIVACSKKTSKPILGAWMGGASVVAGTKLLDAAGIPTYDSPERAINAFMHLVSYARNLETLYETPQEISSLFDLQLTSHRRLADDLFADGRTGPRGEVDAKRLLEAYRIPCTPAHHARTADEAVRIAERLGYPVVVKIDSPQVLHKSDVGGVALDLTDEAEVRHAYERIIDRAKAAVGSAKFTGGVSVQPMMRLSHPVELILGAKRDATFGAVILLGSGGVTAEIDLDRELGLPPLNEALARRMIESLRIWPLLKGYRDRPPLDVPALIDTVVRFSYLVADHAQVTEFDINPLVISEQGVVALDARMTIDKAAGAGDKPYAHLAIRPYPETMIRAAVLKDGTPVTLRPIRPEDEPMWHQMLDSCSPESIRSRFFSLIKEFTHEMATRYCWIDYDREMAIVAETGQGERKRLIGVGRLISDPDRRSAEYAVIVVDEYTGRGLGLLLTDFCMQIADDWGVQEVNAVTHANNRPMLATFRDYRFELDYEREPGLVYATRKRSAVTSPSVS
jgi:acetyltransferase